MIGVGQRAARLDAKHRLMRIRVGCTQVVSVVRRHQRHPRICCQLVKLGDHLSIHLQAVVLQLQIEIAFAKHVLILVRHAFGIVILASE